MIKNLQGKTALITGAASGIGRATSLAFARAGADLVLCDVNEAGLAETTEMAKHLGRSVWALRVDVADRNAMRAFAEQVHKEHGAVDVLVNNAGVGMGGDFLDTTLEDWDWVVSINLWGVIHGCHFFVPPMVARGSGGHIVNISSVAGFLAPRTLSAYAATKFAVFGLSEALREELRPHGIGVSTICPGAINTAIVHTGRVRGAQAEPERRAKVAAIFEKYSHSPDKVADTIVDAVRNGHTVVPVSPEAWIFYFLKRFSPSLTHFISLTMAKRSGLLP